MRNSRRPTQISGSDFNPEKCLSLGKWKRLLQKPSFSSIKKVGTHQNADYSVWTEKALGCAEGDDSIVVILKGKSPVQTASDFDFEMREREGRKKKNKNARRACWQQQESWIYRSILVLYIGILLTARRKGEIGRRQLVTGACSWTIPDPRRC